MNAPRLIVNSHDVHLELRISAIGEPRAFRRARMWRFQQLPEGTVTQVFVVLNHEGERRYCSLFESLSIASAASRESVTCVRTRRAGCPGWPTNFFATGLPTFISSGCSLIGYRRRNSDFFATLQMLLIGLVYGLVIGLIRGLVQGHGPHQFIITPVETVDWSLSREITGGRLVAALINMLVGGLFGGLLFGPDITLVGKVVFGLVLWLVITLVYILIHAVVNAQTVSELGKKIVPNQGIRNSARNAALFGLPGLFVAVAAGTAAGRLAEPGSDLASAVALGQH